MKWWLAQITNVDQWPPASVNCQITTFDNGQEALTALCPPLESEAGAFVPDAILLDLNTPKSDGFEVLVRLQSTPRLAHVPIAIVTSSQATSDKARSDRLGATRYIGKPTQLDEFLSTVGKTVKEAALPRTRCISAGNTGGTSGGTPADKYQEI